MTLTTCVSESLLPRPCAVEPHALVARRNFGDGWSMPRPCAVESHALVAGRNFGDGWSMPRPCAVESHARRYKKIPERVCGCHGLAPWSLTLAATKSTHSLSSRCHGLAPWSLTLAATESSLSLSLSSRCHGLAPWSLTLAAYKKHSLRKTPSTRESLPVQSSSIQSQYRPVKLQDVRAMRHAHGRVQKILL